MSINNDSYSAVSICEVYVEKDNTRKLARLLDYTHNNFVPVPTTTGYPIPLKCYDTLFFNYNQNNVKKGDVGVWQWDGEYYEDQRNYITSEKVNDVVPIEVIWVKNARNVDDVARVLKNEGVQYDIPLFPTTPVLFVTKRGDAGLLLQPGNLYLGVDRNLCITQNIREAELYDPILPQYILKTQSARTGFTRYFWKTPYYRREKTYHLNLEQLVMEAVLARLQDNFKLKDLKALEEVLQTVSRGSICDEVTRRSGADDQTVKNAVDKFLDHVPYVSETTDVKILSVILEKDQRLYEKCVQEVEKMAQLQLPHIVEEAQKIKAECQQQIDQIQKELQEKQKEFEEVDQLVQTARQEEKEIVETRKQFENRLEYLLTQFQLNPGNFLARSVSLSAILRNAVGAPVASTSIQPQPLAQQIVAAPRQLFTQGTVEENAEIKIYDEGEDVVYDLDTFYRDNFIESEINQDFSTLFAGLMYSAYQRRIPLALIGPAAIQLVEAFSCCNNGKKPDVLNCDGEWDQAAVDQAFADTESVLIVKNPFNGAWIDRLIVEISRTPKMVVLVSPFVDDLRIEPQGLFDYIVPIVTSPFVIPNYAKAPTYLYGRHADENFVEMESASDLDKNYMKNAKELGIGRNLRYAAGALISDTIKSLELDPNNDSTLLFEALTGLYSYCHITGREEAFHIQNKDLKVLAKYFN